MIFVMVQDADLLKTNAPISMLKIYSLRQTNLQQSIVDRNHPIAHVVCMRRLDFLIFHLFVEYRQPFCGAEDEKKKEEISNIFLY